MWDKNDDNKKGGRKNLVNIISKLAEKNLNKDREHENDRSPNHKGNEADDSVASVECSLLGSKRRSKRKPEKTVKSVSDEPTDLEEADAPEIELVPHSNLTTVELVLSDDDYGEHDEELDSKKHAGKKKREKRRAKDDPKEIIDGCLKVVNCTACNKSISIKSGKLCRHPDLNTVLCKKCLKFYSSGKFKKDEYGVEEFCRWCADGGELICCDFCEKAFCKQCIKRNLGKSKLKELLKADEDEKWSCFCCDPAPISNLIELCDRALRIQDEKKDLHSPYRDRKGREIIHGPNRGERRNFLTNLSSEQIVKSAEKKPFENGTSSLKEVNVKNEENCEADGGDKNKTVVMTIDSSEDEGAEEFSEGNKASNCEKKELGTNVNQDEIGSSESDAPLSKRVKSRKNESDSNSSEEASRSKKQHRKKKGKSGRKKSDSDSVTVVMSKNRKKNRLVVSSDEESEDDSENDQQTESSEQESSEASARRKKGKNKKYKRRVSSSVDSDSNVSPVKARKKEKSNRRRQVGKWNFRRRRGESSDSDDASDKAKTKKSKRKAKRKVKRKRSDDDDSSDDDDENASPSKKGRRKIRKILDNEKLAEATRHARQLEEERRQRLLEKTKSTVFDKPDTIDLKEVVLEYKPDGKTPLVEVDKDLVKHLKPHQVEGVKFMYDCTIESVERWSKKEEGGGCILAHVMGLGKTLQVVALVHTLYQSEVIELRRVLVVCPLNTTLNWQAEFDKWINVDDRLDVYVMNEAGPSNWHRADMIKKWMNYGGVLIVGYTMYRNLSQCVRIRNKRQKKIFKEGLVDPGPEIVVCDEGHILRNAKSAISVAMNAIKTKRRIALTGTPLQNNLVEYHCMVSFVKPSLLGTLREFSNSFIRPIENGQCADSTAQDVSLMKRRCHVLHKLLDGCVQRKDYAEIARFLPPKFEYVIKVRLAAKQREMYKYYLDTFLNVQEENKGKGGSLFSDYQALMRIWTHPWSLKLETARQIENFVDTDDSLKDFVVESDEEESAVSSEEMSWSSDSSDSGSGKDKRGKKRSKSSSSEQSEGESSEEEIISKSTSKRRSREESKKKEISKTIKSDPDAPSTSTASAGAVIVDGDDEEVKPSVEKAVTGEDTAGGVWVASQLRSGQEFKDKMLLVPEEEWYDKFLTEEDEANVQLGSKVVLLLEILADAAALEEKVLVFSHSLISLDVIEMALGGGEIGGNAEDWCRGCDYFRMDGSTSAQMRKRWADIFNDEENKAARLFLISTKAGGLGINLVGASRVIVFDISWNPSHDVQSIFRSYRFGQNKPVFVYRFIAEGTMEEKIYDRQVTKLSISQRVVDEHQIQRHFNASDLAELYRFEPDVLENEDDERPTPVVPKDAILADMIKRLYPKWIVKYHEHDSLLQNRPEEELTEAERKEAWDHWELEKQGALRPPQVIPEHIQHMLNDANFPNNTGVTIIDATGLNRNIRFPVNGPKIPVPVPQNAVPFGGLQRPAHYQQATDDQQRRRLFEQRKLQEAQHLARLHRLQLEGQRLQAEERQRLQADQQRRQAEQHAEYRRSQQQAQAQAEKQRVEAEKRRLHEQRQREQQQQQQRQQQQQQQRLEQQRLRQEQQMGQEFLQQLLRNRNARVTQQARPGHPNQSVFQVVVDNNVSNDPPRPRRQHSPPRIVELPPDT